MATPACGWTVRNHGSTGRKGETMKSRTLTALIVICWFILAPVIPGARADEWYQGQPGGWHRHGNSWEWRGTHGDEEYEGERGHWYGDRDGGW